MPIAWLFSSTRASRGCLLAEGGLRMSLGDPGVLRAVVGGGLYLTALGLFGLGLGVLFLNLYRGSATSAYALLFGQVFGISSRDVVI